MVEIVAISLEIDDLVFSRSCAWYLYMLYNIKALQSFTICSEDMCI